jgi:DNA-binding LacI/PurR family transcriptional regulator
MLTSPSSGDIAETNTAEAPKRPTMLDVATRAGVSRQLVGIVFRGESGVRDSTRQRILEAAADMGYSPDIAARSLRRRVSQHLGVLFTPAYSAEADIVEGLYPAARKHGFDLVLSALTPTRDEHDAISELLGYRCDALILISPECLGRNCRASAKGFPLLKLVVACPAMCVTSFGPLEMTASGRR